MLDVLHKMKLTEKGEVELRKDLRYAYRHYALNSYGKKVSELSVTQCRNVLNFVLQQYAPFYSSDIENFKQFFKRVFATELRRVSKK